MPKQIGLITGNETQPFVEEMQSAIDQGWQLLHVYAVDVSAALIGVPGTVRHFAVIQRDKPETEN